MPGINPDLELPLALAREGCRRVPAPAAWFDATDRPAARRAVRLGVLQPFLQGASDGWELALRELAKGEDFPAEARALGRATAEVHTALAARTAHRHAGPRPAGALATAMTERLDAAAHGGARAAAVRARAALRVRRRWPTCAAEGRTWTAQRVHGDLHLGQCLRVAGRASGR